MKAATLVGAIFRKISIKNKSYEVYFTSYGIILGLRVRLMHLDLGCYEIYCKRNYQLQYEKDFDFTGYNRELISQYHQQERIWIFDPSYMSKRGNF
jgi:hypothetical protein